MKRTLNAKLSGSADVAPVMRAYSPTAQRQNVSASSIECDLCHFGCELIPDPFAKQACHIACQHTVC